MNGDAPVAKSLCLGDVAGFDPPGSGQQRTRRETNIFPDEIERDRARGARCLAKSDVGRRNALVFDADRPRRLHPEVSQPASYQPFGVRVFGSHGG